MGADCRYLVFSETLRKGHPMRRTKLLSLGLILWAGIITPALQASELSTAPSCADEQPPLLLTESFHQAIEIAPERWEAFKSAYRPSSPLDNHTWAEAYQKLTEFAQIPFLSSQATRDQVKAAVATVLNAHIYLNTHEIASDHHLKTFLQKMAQTYSNCRDQILAALQEPQNTMDHLPLNCTITNLNMFRDTLQSKVTRIQKANEVLNKRLMQQQFLAQIAREEI